VRLFNIDPATDITTNSGVLRVTIRQRSWLIVVLESAVLLTVAIVLYTSWAGMSLVLRILFISALVADAAALTFQVAGTEIVEIDEQKLTVSKEVHGWEWKREYSIKECRELEWKQGAEGTPQGLGCKIGWRTVRFGKNLTENQAIQILTALQQQLPRVANQLCSYPEGKKQFITLGLN
jgi:hypothetical protein